VKDLAAVLDAFSEATKCGAAVWMDPAGARPAFATSRAAPTPPPPVVTTLSPNAPARVFDSDAGEIIVAPVPGARRAWLVLGPCADGAPPRIYVDLLVPVVEHFLHASLEVEHATLELAERYEEINLLYTISEILGRTVSLEEAARTILAEIAETVGARRASILVHDRVTDTLQVVAARGVDGADLLPIATDDATSVSARVFREQHPRLVEGSDMWCDAEAPYRRGAMLSVPIMWTSPDGGRPLGVVNLSDRAAGQEFTAGDQKLVAAIATQIGTAIQNARLVRESLSQQRLQQEMRLAHDLQMKLLPGTGIVAPEAEVAARVVPADSVGGDFYHLFRLGGGRTGVMIADVSSHGYRAALIMALAMSASSIHARDTTDAAEMLAALLDSLREELETTEMFISVFYGVIDPAAGTLRYANTGHPHAFIVGADGSIDRLLATDPPLGMVDQRPSGVERAWRKGEDLLLLFTDGVSDARNRVGARLGEEPVLDVVRSSRAESSATIVDRVFERVLAHTGDAPSRDDQTLVVVRS
jgi:sigma-B regulation protein RsbU (phosphoserine phosphatase)